METTRKLTKTLLTLALLLVLAPALAGNAKAAVTEIDGTTINWSGTMRAGDNLGQIVINSDVTAADGTTLILAMGATELVIKGTLTVGDGTGTLTVEREDGKLGVLVIRAQGNNGKIGVIGNLVVNAPVQVYGGENSSGAGGVGGAAVDGNLVINDANGIAIEGGKNSSGAGGAAVTGSVTVKKGSVSINGSHGSEGENGGAGGVGVGGSLTVEGGIVHVNGGKSAGSVGGAAVAGGVTVKGGDVHVYGGEGTGGGADGFAISGGTVTAYGGKLTVHDSLAATVPLYLAGGMVYVSSGSVGGTVAVADGLTYKDNATPIAQYTSADADAAKTALNAHKYLYLGWESAQAKLGTLTDCKELYPGKDFCDGVSGGTITSVATFPGKTLVCNKPLTVGDGTGTLTVSGDGALTFVDGSTSLGVTGNLAITGGTVKLKGAAGNVAVSGGAVTISSGITGDVTVSGGGTVTATGGLDGGYSTGGHGVSGGATVESGGTLTATGGDSNFGTPGSGVGTGLTLAGGTATVKGGRRLMGGGTADSVGGTAQIAPGFVYRVGGTDCDSSTDSDTIKGLLNSGATASASSAPAPTPPAPVSAGGGNSAPPEPFRQTLPAALVFDGGKVEISPVSAGIGDTVTLTVTPDAGKRLASLTVDRVGGEPLPYEDKGGGVYEFEMPGWRLAFRATFGSDAQPEPEQQPLPSGNAAGVVLSPQTITVNGAAVKVEAYNIGGTNFFMLRDLAALLSGTSAQFNVAFDADRDAVVVTTGEAYAGEVNESFSDRSRRTVPSQQSVELDGQRVSLTAYNIGGNNFFGLRELSVLIGYGVAYDEATNTAIIESK